MLYIEKLTPELAQIGGVDLPETLLQSTSAWAMVASDGIVGYCGIVILPRPVNHVGEVWFRKGPAIQRHRMEVITQSMRLLQDEMKRHRIKCLTAHVDANDNTAMRFALAMGLQKVGVLPKYGAGERDQMILCRGA